MSTKRKNEDSVDSRGWLLPMLLIGVGVLLLAGNVAVSIVGVDEQIITDVASTIGETAGNVGQEVGEAAGDVGREIGEAAGDAGRALGEAFGSVGRSAGQWWPLLLVAIGLGIIVRRPTTKAKRHDTDEMMH